MESRYNIYYAGEVLEGQQAAQVREKLRALFKAGDAALDKLFSGNEQVVKRECDKATALKYKQAMERAGAVPIIRVVRPASTPPAAAPEPTAPPAERKLTAAERIAAVAQAPDVGIAATEPVQSEPEIDAETGWYLEPVGADILRPEERAQPVVAEIDISALDVTEGGGPLAPPSAPTPPPPDTSHLDVSAAGETIPGLPSQQVPVDPGTDHINLSPEGTDFSDCTPPPADAPDVDLTRINLAPEGSDVLDPQYRRGEAPPAPSTEHISLQD